jgi:hypothetical protein
MPGIASGPHYELPSSELAAWLEMQGKDRWWNVDGDPLLTGHLEFPCPADELADELRRLNRPLLVQVKMPEAKGQRIDRNQIDGVVSRFHENIHTNGRECPPWASDRFLYLGWKGSGNEWILAEDSMTTKQSRADVASKAE